MKFSIRSSANQENIIHHQSTSANQSSPHTHTHTKSITKQGQREVYQCMYVYNVQTCDWLGIVAADIQAVDWLVQLASTTPCYTRMRITLKPT